MSRNIETTARAAADCIVAAALEFMASKASDSVENIRQTILADPEGYAARYFGKLIAHGIDFASNELGK